MDSGAAGALTQPTRLSPGGSPASQSPELPSLVCALAVQRRSRLLQAESKFRSVEGQRQGETRERKQTPWNYFLHEPRAGSAGVREPTPSRRLEELMLIGNLFLCGESVGEA